MDRPSRAERRSQKVQRVHVRQDQEKKNLLELTTVTPKTHNQENIFNEFYNGKNLLIHGLPGTGKSFLSMYLALNELAQYDELKRIVIIRSVVPSRDMGFLPGSIKEKSAVYEAPYKAICQELYGRGDAYELMKAKGIIEFTTSSFLRGITIDNSIVIVDECQNMTYHELCTIVTRMGKHSKIVFCGDYNQSDLKYDDDKSGIIHFMKIIASMKRYFATIEMNVDDIVRSGLVKEFIIRKNSYENPRVVVVPSSYQNSGDQKVFH